jgi:CBS domain-containing protein
MQIRITVRQLLLEKGPTVWTVDPDASVFDALQLMADKNVGALPVVAGGQLVGIFSERDYARKVILHGQASRETPVSAIMTSNVVTVSPDQDLSDCMRIMTDKRIRHLPVIEGGRQVGVLSIGDVMKAVLAEQEFLIGQLSSYIGGATV